MYDFKCFLLHSGVDEFPHLEADEMAEALAEIKTFNSLLIVLAAEIPNGATAFKCCPPVREVSTREMLWRGW